MREDGRTERAGSGRAAVGALPFIRKGFRGYRFGQVVTVDDPWGYGNSLESAPRCLRPRRNFTLLPRIRSERPEFGVHDPVPGGGVRAAIHTGRRGHAALSEAVGTMGGGR